MERVDLFHFLRHSGVPFSDESSSTVVGRREGRVAARIIGKFPAASLEDPKLLTEVDSPGENSWAVFVPINNYARVVQELLNDFVVAIKLVMVLRVAEDSNIGIHAA